MKWKDECSQWHEQARRFKRANDEFLEEFRLQHAKIQSEMETNRQWSSLRQEQTLEMTRLRHALQEAMVKAEGATMKRDVVEVEARMASTRLEACEANEKLEGNLLRENREEVRVLRREEAQMRAEVSELAASRRASLPPPPPAAVAPAKLSTLFFDNISNTRALRASLEGRDGCAMCACGTAGQLCATYQSSQLAGEALTRFRNAGYSVHWAKQQTQKS